MTRVSKQNGETEISSEHLRTVLDDKLQLDVPLHENAGDEVAEESLMASHLPNECVISIQGSYGSL